MVNVATLEEFEEFKSSMRKLLGDCGKDCAKRVGDIEKRLDDVDKKLDGIVERLDDSLKAFGELTAHIDKTETAIYERVDEVEVKSKSVITRIKEAFESESG